MNDPLRPDPARPPVARDAHTIGALDRRSDPTVPDDDATLLPDDATLLPDDDATILPGDATILPDDDATVLPDNADVPRDDAPDVPLHLVLRAVLDNGGWDAARFRAAVHDAYGAAGAHERRGPVHLIVTAAQEGIVGALQRADTSRERIASELARVRGWGAGAARATVDHWARALQIEEQEDAG